MTVLGVIPARYASVRLPAKPLVDLLGKPMIQHVVEQARKARSITRVVVATDDERIAQVVRGFGGEVAITSPDIRSGSDRVAAVASLIDADLYVNIQGDEPLIRPDMIDEAVDVVRRNPDAQVGTLVRTLDSPEDLMDPAIVKVAVASSGKGLYFSRSPIPHVRDEADTKRWPQHQKFYKHIGIYVFRKKALLQYASLPEGILERAEKLEQLRLLESGVDIWTGVTEFDSVPVDMPDDVEKVREILKSVGRRQ